MNYKNMETETNVDSLIRNMRPGLEEKQYVFCTFGEDVWRSLSVTPICLFREEEGWSAVLEEADANRIGAAYNGIWAHITLEVYSDLQAIGFLAKVTSVLAEQQIPVNPVSAFHHDHLFVPWELRKIAMKLLTHLQDS